MRSLSSCLGFAILAVLPCLTTAQSTNYSEYVFITDLGASYSYAVHAPLNTTAENTPPPCVLYLGGTGERYEAGQTEAPDRVASFGGHGWRVDNYANGTRDGGDIIAAEQFLTIVPMYLDEDQDTMWNISAVYDVLNNARTHYTWDESRLYLTSFSMGARTAWPMLIDNPTYFTAATIVSGVPVLDVAARDAQINYTGMENLLNVPIWQFAGQYDYENASQVWQHQAVQDHLVSLGDQNINFTIVPEGQHGDMQQLAFSYDMFAWLLTHQKNETAVAEVSASLSSAGISASASPNAIAAAASDSVETTSSAQTSHILSAGLLALSLAVVGTIF